MRRAPQPFHGSVLGQSMRKTSIKTHSDPAKIVEVRGTAASCIGVGPLNNPLHGAGDERGWLPYHSKEVVVLEVLTNLALNLSVAETGDDTNKDGVQPLIFVSENSIVGSLPSGVSCVV